MMSAAASPQADREIVSSRVFPAAPAEVFAAFSDPRRLAEWWGPQGFTNTFQEFDARPGGRWASTMRGPDGKEFPIAKRFVEYAPPGRVVLRHEQQGHAFTMTMTYLPEGAGTRLTWTILFDSAADCAPVRPFIVAGNEENFDRLAAHLAKKSRSPVRSGPGRSLR